jgi:hypothetical protein
MVQTGRRHEVSRYESLFWDTVPMIGHSVHVDRNDDGSPRTSRQWNTCANLWTAAFVEIISNPD